ncbi:MAG: LPXTG cell wall anchor domain-containing protein [Eubacteriales bacterium]|nr:LPXTG cell wall anchor domain-containing protein [Eubacteriales bacterium]
MYKHMRRFLCILTMLTWGISMTVQAADAAVRYEGTAHNFVFDEDGRQLSDLFLNFKDVMPGDVLTQKIILKNNRRNRFRARIYLRYLGGIEEKEFLAQMKLRVKKENDTELFFATPDEPAGLADWVELGTISPGREMALNLELAVPVSVDNQFQDKIGKLQWEFKVAELPIRKGDGSSGSRKPGNSGSGADASGTGPGAGGNGPGAGQTGSGTGETGPGTGVTNIGANGPGGAGAAAGESGSGMSRSGSAGKKSAWRNPKTGDESSAPVWMLLAAASGGGLAVLAVRRKRRDS